MNQPSLCPLKSLVQLISSVNYLHVPCPLIETCEIVLAVQFAVPTNGHLVIYVHVCMWLFIYGVIL